MHTDDYFSIPFQILQECPFKCGVCNRRYELGERRLSNSERFKIVENLIPFGLKRLTVTGGEPMVLGDEIFEFLYFLNQNKVHSCLSTTGLGIDSYGIQKLDQFLDQLLISIPTLDLNEWKIYFGNTKKSEELYNDVLNILHDIKDTGIILEINTVLNRENMDSIFDLGEKLYNINSNIIWRIEYYYANGIKKMERQKYELNKDQIMSVYNKLDKEFAESFNFLYLSKPNRESSLNLFLTPDGSLVTRNDNNYSAPVGNALKNDIPLKFYKRRAWSEYEIYCREWNW